MFVIHFRRMIEMFTADRDYTSTNWGEYEDFLMWREVLIFNKDVAFDQVKRVSRMSQGDSDYMDKFGLYCAELALGVEDPQP